MEAFARSDGNAQLLSLDSLDLARSGLAYRRFVS
jgi:hypothetical protein